MSDIAHAISWQISYCSAAIGEILAHDFNAVSWESVNYVCEKFSTVTFRNYNLKLCWIRFQQITKLLHCFTEVL